MGLYLEVIVMFYLTSLGRCDVSYNYEKLNHFGVGNRVMWVVPFVGKYLPTERGKSGFLLIGLMLNAESESGSEFFI